MTTLLATTHVADRFWAKVVKTTTCWRWQGAPQSRGYGIFSVGPRHSVRRLLAHRVAWELTRGLIPDGLTIDHLCGVKLCVNPDHLEVVTRAENTVRAHMKSHCIRGHLMSETRRIDRSGRPSCIECQRVRNARRYA